VSVPHPQELEPTLLRLLGAAAYRSPPQRLGGGYWAALYGFELAGHETLRGPLVLRVMPTSDEKCAREAAMQAAISRAGFPAPRVHLSGGRGDGLGFPYIVMQRLAGSALGIGSLWQLPGLLGGTLAALHRLDTSGLPGAGLELVLDELAERAAPLEDDSLRRALGWLAQSRPEPRRRVICHGDFHPLNLLLERGSVSGVLDWTHAHLGEPEFDAAYAALMLRLWPLDRPWLPRRWLKGPLGTGAARAFLRSYRAPEPLDAGRFAWYESLHLARILVRVARARAGVTRPPLGPRHPWELAARDASQALEARCGFPIRLPEPCTLPLAS
jgi:aminoglycoside phosphotransferase (APT) family kinase protein